MTTATPVATRHLVSTPWCLKCQRPLGLIARHETEFGERYACSPLCERCWKQAGCPHERLPFYRALWKTWRGPWLASLDSEWRAMKRAVMEGR